MQRFGEKLHALRERRGLTVRQLASMLEIRSHSHIVEIEKGKNKPSVELVIKVADVFDVSIDRLLRDNLELLRGGN
jgi:transcriptional regulator with XRE-family HTH domain